MNGPNSFSLSHRSNKITVVFLFLVVMAGLWMNGNQISAAFFLAASIIGVIRGILRCLGFGERPWQHGVNIGLLLFIYLLFFHASFESRDFITRLFMFLTFLSIATLWAFLVVELKELHERRQHSR